MLIRPTIVNSYWKQSLACHRRLATSPQVHCQSAPFYKRLWPSNKSKSAIDLNEPDPLLEQETAEEVEQQKEWLRKERNKSRLRASDRLRLHGEAPLAGIQWQKTDYHRSREFKGTMLGKYGQEASRVNPSELWPNDEEMELQREYEHVLFDGKSLQEIIKEEQQRQEEARNKVLERESKVAENLAKLEKEKEAWRRRVTTKIKQKEQALKQRENILAELRQEFGYEVNPNSPEFAEKIAAKEKALRKEEKQKKKDAP